MLTSFRRRASRLTNLNANTNAMQRANPPRLGGSSSQGGGYAIAPSNSSITSSSTATPGDVNPSSNPNVAKSSGNNNGTSGGRTGVLVPTNTVTTKDGQTVRARIEPSLAVDDVIRQLCVNLKIQEPPVMFALRDENDELVTDDNLRRKIKDRVKLKWVMFRVFCGVWN